MESVSGASGVSMMTTTAVLGEVRGSAVGRAMPHLRAAGLGRTQAGNAICRVASRRTAAAETVFVAHRHRFRRHHLRCCCRRRLPRCVAWRYSWSGARSAAISVSEKEALVIARPRGGQASAAQRCGLPAGAGASASAAVRCAGRGGSSRAATASAAVAASAHRYRF